MTQKMTHIEANTKKNHNLYFFVTKMTRKKEQNKMKHQANQSLKHIYKYTQYTWYLYRRPILHYKKNMIDNKRQLEMETIVILSKNEVEEGDKKIDRRENKTKTNDSYHKIIAQRKMNTTIIEKIHQQAIHENRFVAIIK